MPTPIPNITTISQLQRKGKKALSAAFKKKETAPVFISDHGNISGVFLNIKDYEKLTKNIMSDEGAFWMQAANSNLDFWNDPSNDAYEKLV